MPDWKRVARARLEELRMTGAAESDLAEEMAQHLEDRYRESRSAGDTEQEAYRKAVAELEDMAPVRAGLRRRQRMPGREDLWRDLRYAVRTLRKSPAFVAFVVATLALGIGANTTVFTVINTLFLNPLPARDVAGLAAVEGADASNRTATFNPLPLSYTDLRDYQARNEVFESLSGHTSARVATFEDAGVSSRMFAELVTANYFDTLGLMPAKGRFFLPEEEATPGSSPVAVMNYGVWQRRFGGAEDIVGRTLRLNNLVFTVVGVAPPRFIGVNAIFGPDVWIPAAMAERFLPNEMRNALTDRRKTIFTGVGRLKPGVTRAQAQANLSAIASNLAREYPAADEGRTMAARPVRDAMFGSSATLASMVFAGAALLIVVAIVLLIACSNVANLLLARSAGRQKEMAVRLAMGASRPRLIRQMLTESVLLGILSGALGLAVAYAGLQLLFGALPGTANFPTPRLDVTVFAYALGLSVATGLLFGAIPAFKVTRTSVAETLKEESRSTGRSRAKVTVGNALLVGQVAFSFLLLVTAALFLRSIGRAYQIDPGFQTAHLALFMVNPGQAGYGKPQTLAYYKDVRERVARLPGVESVSWSSNLPLWARPVNGIEIEGRQQRSRTDTTRAILNTIDRDYFETAGVAMVSGRKFGDLDRENALPVAIVNEKMARDYWPGGALGRRLRLPGETSMRQIVGVARTANYSSWAEPPQPCVYAPLEQNYSDGMTLYVRSRQDPREVLVPVEREMRQAGPQVLVSDRRTGTTIVENGLFNARIGVTLLSIFGLLALGLASIGLYGILAYTLNQRRREIGLRMALGATRAGVLALVLREGLSLVAAGVAIGLVASLAAGRLLSRMLYGVSAADPASLAVAAATLTAVALTACYLPARRATRVDPSAALREA